MRFYFQFHGSVCDPIHRNYRRFPSPSPPFRRSLSLRFLSRAHRRRRSSSKMTAEIILYANRLGEFINLNNIYIYYMYIYDDLRTHITLRIYRVLREEDASTVIYDLTMPQIRYIPLLYLGI